MNKIRKIAKDVVKITDEDVQEVKAIIEQQESYTNPLKSATVGWQHELAHHNKEVLDSVLDLKKIVEKGFAIKKP